MKLIPKAGLARPAYHEMMAILGVGDLHPGGLPATEFLLTELGKANPRTVLEVGAGGGLTTARMIKRGWQVTAIEPSTVLCAQLKSRFRIPVHVGPFETFEDDGTGFDAVIGEGVFYRLDLASTVSKLHRLVRPGGLLAFVEMMWTDAAEAGVVAFIHDQTKEIFGIPMIPRQVVTSSKWEAALRNAGFSEVVTKKIEPSTVDSERHIRRARLSLGLLTHPGLVPLFLTYRLYRQISWAPPGWLESWMTVWKRS